MDRKTNNYYYFNRKFLTSLTEGNFGCNTVEISLSVSISLKLLCDFNTFNVTFNFFSTSTSFTVFAVDFFGEDEEIPKAFSIFVDNSALATRDSSTVAINIFFRSSQNLFILVICCDLLSALRMDMHKDGTK